MLNLDLFLLVKTKLKLIIFQTLKLIKVKERSIDGTSNYNIVTNSQALKISSEQLKNVKRQKKEEFYQFKSKQPLDNSMNESL